MAVKTHEDLLESELKVYTEFTKDPDKVVAEMIVLHSEFVYRKAFKKGHENGMKVAKVSGRGNSFLLGAAVQTLILLGVYVWLA